MKTKSSHSIYLGVTLLLSVLLYPQRVYPQISDSLTNPSTSNGAIQFQLIGSIGIYYIGDWSPASHVRLGADVLFNHSDQSGSNNGYSINTSTPPPSSSSSSNTSEPDKTSNSYQISLSALYLQKLAEYKHTSMYFGFGPMASYSWSRYTNKYKYSFTYSYNNTTTSTNNDENTSKTLAIGPMAIIGIRSQLLDHVGLSAEIGLSAVYQWSTQSYSYSSTYDSPYPNSSTSNQGSVSHLKGWAISISAIRIGLIIDL